jgi:hypothetical protein
MVYPILKTHKNIGVSGFGDKNYLDPFYKTKCVNAIGPIAKLSN